MLRESLSSAETGYQGMAIETMLQQSLGCGVLVVDPQDKILSMTGEAARALGASASQIKSPDFQKLPSSVQSIIREVQLTGQPLVDRKLTLHTQQARPSSVIVSALPVNSGKPNANVVLVIREFPSMPGWEQGLRQLNRLASIGTLSASMAHEIRNALVAAKTFVDLLLEKNRDAELAGLVHKEMGRVNSIVGQMLKFAAPGQLKFARIELHKSLDHSLKLVQHRVENKLISFDQQFNAVPDALEGDEDQLQQAFLNLYFNAIEAMPSGGKLTVSTDLVPGSTHAALREGAVPSSWMRIKVADTGAGIAPENMPHMFEPFFTTKETGTGLGLSVTRRIIEEHGGTIAIESSPGQGTCFVILLPGGSKAGGR